MFIVSSGISKPVVEISKPLVAKELWFYAMIFCLAEDIH